jgi:Holliday junction resolvasome RuvABC DNA-binding subunit
MDTNEAIAGKLDEVSRLLAEQGANRYRVQAYQRAADALRQLTRPVGELFDAKGIEGLEAIPGVGESIARSIRDMFLHGRLAMLDRLRGEHDPIALLSTVPGIGKVLAHKLHDELDLGTLEDLEAAAHDGRLETIAGVGAKRLAGIRDSLAHRLGRVPRSDRSSKPNNDPSVAELLDIDQEYQREAAAGRLRLIAPRRFNPKNESWLPVMHTHRDEHHYTVLYSNTARAHQLKKTHDWVVIYRDGREGERQWTVITSTFGRLKGRRIVRGREAECEDLYRE